MFFAATAAGVTKCVGEEYGIVPVKLRKLSKAKFLTGTSMGRLNICFVHTVSRFRCMTDNLSLKCRTSNIPRIISESKMFLLHYEIQTTDDNTT